MDNVEPLQITTTNATVQIQNSQLEHTGHYHLPLVEYLQELDISVYVMPVQKRPVGMLKTEKRDALSLGNHLYNQLEKGIQLADRTHLVRRLLPPTEAALHLKRWMRHRYELSRECTRRKNKLVAICDELFPQFTQVMRDPNAPMALAIREHFPTPPSGSGDCDPLGSGCLAYEEPPLQCSARPVATVG